jgi:uncharacterized membrane protein YccC
LTGQVTFSALSVGIVSYARKLGPAIPAVGLGLRIAASVSLALLVAFWLPLDNASWVATSAAVVCQPILGASLRKAWYRLLGTLIGAAMIVTLAALFVQNRAAFLTALALWGALCAFTATLLRNFAAYAASLAGYTAVIIANDALGATGGLGHPVFMLAVSRASEICTGIICAGVVLALTDVGGARRHLVLLMTRLVGKIGVQFVAMLATRRYSPTIRRELIREVIELDPVIDQAIGESSELRHDASVLQRAIDGLFNALSSWRAIDTHLANVVTDCGAQQDVDAIVHTIARAGLPAQTTGLPWQIPDPVALRHRCLSGSRLLLSSAPESPTGELLAEQTASLLLGLSTALQGLSLLIADGGRVIARSRRLRLAVADWVPSWLNAGRALITIAAAAAFWVITGWPSGALCITWAAITVILFGPRGENAYAWSFSFLAGTVAAAVMAAIAEFAVLPQLHSFAALCAAFACYLIPLGALSAHFRQSSFFTAMTANFVPLVAPANLTSYDTTHFFNVALALCAGCGFAVISFKLLPPLSAPARARRLLQLSLRDLRRLATGRLRRNCEAWQSLMHARLVALPDAAEPLERAQLVAALSAGTAIIRLERLTGRLCLGGGLAPALGAVARGRTGLAIEELARLDVTLSNTRSCGRLPRLVAHARASVLALSEVLRQHRIYFECGSAP